jgi:hypothetical protein
MSEHEPHPEALRNYEAAHIPEEKIRLYALSHPAKRRMFEALGYSLERGNWEALRDRIREALPLHEARSKGSNEYGDLYYVDMLIAGPEGKKAPVRATWIYKTGEDFPRLTTLFIQGREWRRMSKESRIES